MGDDGLRVTLLVVHIAAGSLALICAAVVMATRARQDWGTRWGRAYVGLVVAVAVSAVGLAAAGSTLPVVVRWVLVVVATVTAAAAVRGHQLARRRGGGSGSTRPGQLRLMWGSVTSLVSAVALVSAPVYVWVPDVVVGTALTELAYRRAQRDLSWS